MQSVDRCMAARYSNVSSGSGSTKSGPEAAIRNRRPRLLWGSGAAARHLALGGVGVLPGGVIEPAPHRRASPRLGVAGVLELHGGRGLFDDQSPCRSVDPRVASADGVDDLDRSEPGGEDRVDFPALLDRGHERRNRRWHRSGRPTSPHPPIPAPGRSPATHGRLVRRPCSHRRASASTSARPRIHSPGATPAPSRRSSTNLPAPIDPSQPRSSASPHA